ncbi:Yip1 family protein [Streptomyces sp. MS06]|uniref:Yip1 family protein n=1 Tax=Streptomyces sp. MS06 TaxID=3385974 RepID=UPI00399FA8C2
MSQVRAKADPADGRPAHRAPEPGTFESVAAFRMGRGGRNDRAAQTRPQQQPPHGQPVPQGPPPGYPQAPHPYRQAQHRHQQYGGGGPAGPSRPAASWPQPNGGGGRGGGAHGEPEYFGDGPAPHTGGPSGVQDPYAANNPGHTQAFSVDDQAPYDDGYSQGGTYHAGSAAQAAPVGPRLHWKELLRGIVLSPDQTFLRMRDHTMWGPALIVTFLYGLLAVFGFDGARSDAINATLANAVPIVLITAVAMVVSAFVLGAVTHTLARQLGGDGSWQPTVGLSMLIMSLTDAPRLVFAMFAGGDAGFVQALGWATWVAAGFLLTRMVARSHDLPWPKALGAASIQLIALLSIVKLGTF